jgi:type I restriction enzyme S subunit
MSALVQNPPPAVFASYLIRFHPLPIADCRYVAFFLKTPPYQKAIADNAAGIAQPNVNAKKLSKIAIPLPPVSEQLQIVAEIEKHFTRLDSGVTTLVGVEKRLRNYHSSLLEAAFEGHLVPQEAKLADSENRDFEAADALLRRILEERRRKWEIQHSALRINRKPRKGLKHSYEVPFAPNTGDLPELPDGWVWATWGQIGFCQNGRVFPSKQYQKTGIRLLRPGNLHVSGRVVWTEQNTRYMSAQWASKFPEHIVGPRELVMNLTAQSLKDEFLGRVCMTGNSEHCLLNQRIARLTPILVSSDYLFWLFKSPYFRRFVDSLNTGSLIQHMFTSQLRKFVMPLPPLAEQERIARELERRLSIAEQTETVVRLNITRAGRMRQSILKCAFDGSLTALSPKRSS